MQQRNDKLCSTELNWTEEEEEAGGEDDREHTPVTSWFLNAHFTGLTLIPIEIFSLSSSPGISASCWLVVCCVSPRDWDLKLKGWQWRQRFFLFLLLSSCWTLIAGHWSWSCVILFILCAWKYAFKYSHSVARARAKTSTYHYYAENGQRRRTRRGGITEGEGETARPGTVCWLD